MERKDFKFVDKEMWIEGKKLEIGLLKPKTTEERIAIKEGKAHPKLGFFIEGEFKGIVEFPELPYGGTEEEEPPENLVKHFDAIIRILKKRIKEEL